MKDHDDHEHNVVSKAGIYVITVSDTRTRDDDRSGKLILDFASRDGRSVSGYEIIPDEADSIRSALERAVSVDGCDAIIMTGGTGIAPRDVTIGTVGPILDREMPGFGEMFRHLSYQEIGVRGLISGALAGVYSGKLVFCLPGSKNAVALALDKLIGPGLGHMLWEVRRK